VPTATHWIPEDLWETWKKFIAIAKREGRSAGQILNEFMANYVRIHEPGNPQWSLDRWKTAEVPKLNSEEPMPDYRAWSDEQLLALWKHPHKLRDKHGDRQIIAHILKKRGLRAEAETHLR